VAAWASRRILAVSLVVTASSPPHVRRPAARARTLETTNREVAQRLDAAIDTIRTVLAANER